MPLSLTDVMTSLTTRRIDAAATTPFGAVAFRWYSRFTYMGEYPIANGIVGVIVTKNIKKTTEGLTAQIVHLVRRLP